MDKPDILITVEIKADTLAAAITALANALGAKLPNTPAAPAPTAIPLAAPVYQPTAPAPAPAPVQTPPPTAAAPTYTADQLAIAATQLMDAGRRNELVNLLKSFGVSALTQLPKEQYGAFATALRELGAKI